MNGFFARTTRRIFTRVGFLFGFALALAAMMSPQQALGATTTISDANFGSTVSKATWTLSTAVGVATNPPGGCQPSAYYFSLNSVHVTTIPSGGAPTTPPYLLMELDNHCPYAVWGTYIYNAASFNSGGLGPSTSPAITSMDFSIDFSCPPGPPGPNDNTGCYQDLGFALEQGGKYYYGGGSWKVFDSSTWNSTWHNYSRSGLTQPNSTGPGGDFAEMKADGPDPNSHPDFSCAGGPIHFGFITASDARGTINTTLFKSFAGYDNWSAVIHSEKCPHATGTLHLTKIVSPSMAGYPQFWINTRCTEPNGTVHTGTTTVSTGGALGGTYPINTVCVFQEIPLPPPPNPPAGCSWKPPTYSPAASTTSQIGSITIGPGTNNATVTNTYTCALGIITMNKTVDDPLKVAAGQKFPSTYQCKDAHGTPDGNGNFLAYNGSSFQSNLMTLPSTCQMTETLPSPFTYQGQTCTWNTPTYTPPLAVTVNSASQTVTVTNSYTCVTPCPGCGKQQNPTPRAGCADDQREVHGKCKPICDRDEHWNGGKCVSCDRSESWNANTKGCVKGEGQTPASVRSGAGCPEGQQLIEGQCRLVCDPPMVPNKKGTKCECPEGTELVDGKCGSNHSDKGKDDRGKRSQ